MSEAGIDRLAYKRPLAITVNSARCTGCLICQLRCSFRFEKTFNPLMAAIVIARNNGGSGQFEISFTDKCDGCGLCVRYCPYGALTTESGEQID